MFDSVPKKYIFMNRVLTIGQDKTWRKKALDLIEPRGGDKILDICTGTGDLALKIAENFPYSKVYAIDFSPKMLDHAKRRARDLKVRNITFIECDCTNMGFSSNHFDYITISFGFRNLSYSKENLRKSLKEVYRVLKNGGRFVILETSQPENAFMKNSFHFYAARIVPKIGTLLSGQRAPYAYLGTSIVKFLDRDELDDILSSSGFKIEKAISFMFGMISLWMFKKDEKFKEEFTSHSDCTFCPDSSSMQFQNTFAYRQSQTAPAIPAFF